MTAAPGDYSAAVLSQTPVGYWRLNETVQPPPPSNATNLGSLLSAANGRYLFGPRRGEPGAFPGAPATSVRFFNPDQEPGWGGSRVEVSYNKALNPTGPFSVEFWAKPSLVVTDAFCMVASLNSDPAIGPTATADPRAGWLFYQNGSPTNNAGNQWQFRLGNATGYLDGDAIRGGTVTTGVWHYIVGTFDGSKAILYVNGIQVAARDIQGYLANDARPFRMGTSCFDGLLGPVGSYAGNRGFDGWLQDVAFYGSALSPAEITAHYDIARTNATGYATRVLSQKPIGYWRLGEPGNPPAVNLGSLGANGNGQYVYPAHPGQSGPEAPAFPGLEVDNKACAFAGTNGFVDLPPLDLNTNTVTITAWILASATEPNNAGIVFNRSGTTVAGLKFDLNDPNGLSYNWNDDTAASNFKSGLTVPVFQWSFVALSVQPDRATLCLQDGTQFSTAVNFAVHPEQAFEGDTLIGRDIDDPALTFNGIIDEVAVFKRALSVGEIYSLYAAAVGGLKPTIFSDLQLPPDPVYPGDTLTLRVDAGGTPPLTYEWRKDGKVISGVTGSTFTKANVDATDAGTYEVAISNAFGSLSTQRITLTLQPLTTPSITQDPQGRSLYPGGTLNLSVQASGGGLSYEWRKNGAAVPGATNATYRVPSVTVADEGAYQVLVSNRVGNAPSASAQVTIVRLTAGSYADLIVRDAPEAWWRLDEPAGASVMADAMGRHDGTYQGGVTLASPGVLVGDTNTAAVFDGSSGYGEVPFSKALNTTNFTVECWARANPVLPAMCPVGSFTQPPGRGYLIHKSEDGQWFYMFGDAVDTAMLIVDGTDAIYGKWVHFALTYDGVDYSAYLNGRLDASASVNLVPNNVAPFRIGFDQPGDGWNDFWDGAIDEVVFYPKALSEDQIVAHYAAALFPAQSKPVFTRQPASDKVQVGTFFYFDPVVEGTPPFSYQWSRNGTPLAGETNWFLVFPDLNYANSGTYQLTATNKLGSAVSAPATLVALPAASFAQITNGLVLHLKFDGDYKDVSGRTNDARPIGAPRFIAGQVGKSALHYRTVVNASNPNRPVVTSADYVTLGAPADLQFGTNVNFSISYWVRMSGAPGDLPFFCNAFNAFTNPGFTFAPSYQLGGWSWSLGDVSTAQMIGFYGQDDSINDGNWHHLVHTFDRSGSGVTYLDGNWADSRSIAPLIDLNTGDETAIGQDPSGAYPEAGEADIDDVGVWHRVLEPFEVASIYSAGKAGNSFDTAGPVSLGVARDADRVLLLWQAGTLVSADNLSGPWVPVKEATPPMYEVAPKAARQWYQVQP